MTRRTFIAAAALVVLAACENGTPQKLPPLPPAAEEKPGTSDDRTSGPIATDRPSQAAPGISLGAAGTPSQPPPLPRAAAGGDVTLSFADTDLRTVVQQVLGDILKVNYTIDPAVRGTVTFKTGQPLARDALLPVLETLLNQNGATLVQTGNLYRVLPTAAALSTPSLARETTGGTAVVPLRYAAAADLAKVIEPVIGQGGARVTADTTRNAILITGDSAARATIESLVHAFDIDLLAGQSYGLFPITSTDDPQQVATELQQAFQTEGEGALARTVRIVPMVEANAILVVAPQPRLIDDARRLFRLIDQTRRSTERSWHIYYVRNGQSAEIANVLQRAFTPNNVTAMPTAAAGSSPTAPGLNQTQMNAGSSPNGTGTGTAAPGSTGGTTGTSGSGATGGLLGETSSAGGSSGLGGANQLSATSGSPATQALSSDAGSTNGMRIVVGVNNAILIYATQEEEDAVEAMERKLDVLPRQVRIDATVAEVTLTDQLQYGTQFFLKVGGVNGLLSNAANATPSTLAGNFPGFVLTGATANADVVLSALSQVTNVRVLSSPQVMVLDNQPARLLVGNDVPYLTQSSQSTITTNAPIVNSVNYRETGVILNVVPRVGKGGLVTLDLYQEVSAVGASETVGGIQSPTFSERQVQSRVVVQDGQTVGLAGLISDNDSEGNAGIPILKDLPVVGSLFSTQTNQRQRTELLVLITPHVMEDQHEARALTEDMRQDLIRAALAPQELKELPASGLPNPNAAIRKAN